MGIVKVVCAYCKKEIGYKHCSMELNGMVSHGACDACAKIEHAKIDKMIKEKKV